MKTAEEFLKISGDKFAHSDGMEEAMIEFAKHHVEAALIAAHKQHQIPMEELEFTTNAYPLTNIK